MGHRGRWEERERVTVTSCLPPFLLYSLFKYMISAMLFTVYSNGILYSCISPILLVIKLTNLSSMQHRVIQRVFKFARNLAKVFFKIYN